jgi:hypothetical protein
VIKQEACAEKNRTVTPRDKATAYRPAIAGLNNARILSALWRRTPGWPYAAAKTAHRAHPEIIRSRQ